MSAHADNLVPSSSARHAPWDAPCDAPVDRPSQPPLQDSRCAAQLFWILLAGAAGMAALLAFLPAAGHDQLWFLLMARRWLAGAVLYGPLAFDSNPPAIVWLSSIPIALGTICHVPATLVGKLLVTLLETACAALSFRFLKPAWRKPRSHEAVALLFAAILLFYVVPARDFGQRDHLVSFLLLPYVLAAASPHNSASRALRFIAGTSAALAICLKPHHALVPLGIEAAILLFPALTGSPDNAGAPGPDSRRRVHGPHLEAGSPPVTALLSRVGWQAVLRPEPSFRNLFRPEPILLVLIGVLYMTAIHRFTPLYLTRAIPLTRSVYWGIGHLTVSQLLWEAIELCILAALALWIFGRRQASSTAVRLLLLAGAASFVAYLLQGTGWYYQQLPAISFFGLALALELLDGAGVHLVLMPAWPPRAAAALVVLALALTTHFTGYPFTPDRAFAIDSPDPALFAALRPGTPVAILTTSVDEAMMPVERYHLTWAQRTNNLWLLPAILRSESAEHAPATRLASSAQSALRLSPGALDELEVLQHRWMVEDLDRWRPQLVLIERCQDEAVRCQVLEDRHDDLLAWFQRDPAFTALWQHYTFTGTDARFDVYTHRP